jgi:predicted ribosomally synthesized peptide with SipW-like signal peptide
MQKIKNKRLMLGMLTVCLAVLTILSGTFAWFTASDDVTNHLEAEQLTNGDVKISEIFDPEPLNPGVEVVKRVSTVNTGSADAFVRISFAEALTMMTSATADQVATAYSGAANTIPQIFDADSIATGGAYAGWSNLASPAAGDFAGTVATVPAGVTTLYKKTVIGGKNYYEFVSYAAISITGNKYDGMYQAVKVEYKVDPTTGNVTIAPIDIDTTGSSPNLVNAAFYQFNTQATATQKVWSALNSTHAPFDTYTLDTPVPATDFNTAGAAIVGDAQADANIKLLFNASVKTNLSACAVGDWWYNAADGYFYYIGLLKSGQSTINPVLDALKLDQASGSLYSNLQFDLTPCMDGIQALADAIQLTGGWALGTAAGSDGANLIAQFTALGIL